MSQSIRSIFISDIHLGCKFSQTEYFLDFIKWVDKQRPQQVYIVGDFIDGWQLKRNWYWDKNCNLIIRKIFSLLKHDVKVFYVAGNHDEFIRNFIDEIHEIDLSGLKIADEFIHVTPNGEDLLVIHGDKFDAAIRYAMKYTRFLCTLGDWGYGNLIKLNRLVNWVRYRLNLPYWSLSKAIKHQFKQAVNYVGGFEEILVDYAKEKKCQGVICGHIHTPGFKKIKDIWYYNCGDWVESNSAIIEYEDGRMQLINHYDFSQE